MNIIDLTVYSILGLVAAFPAVRALIAKIRSRVPAAPAPANGDTWTQKWTFYLIELVEELEQKDQPEAAQLGRELIWLLIGGQPDSPQEKKR